MKICFISKNIYPVATGNISFRFAGGAEIQFLILSEVLRKGGNNIFFITDDFGQDDEVTINDATYIKIPFRYMEGNKFKIVSDWFLLFEKLKELNADVYLMKSPRFNLFLLAIFSKLTEKKCIFVSTIDTDSDPNLLQEIDPFYRRILYRIGLRLIPIVISQTEHQQKSFMQNFKKRSIIIKNIYRIRNNIKFKKKDFVLWVGTNNNVKNPELFLQLAQKTPNIKYKMAMIPSNDFKKQAKLEKKISKIKNIEYLGFVPEVKMDKIYSGASILVNFSELEGFPNIFLHAWSHRTPVISLKVNPDNILEKHKMGFCSGTMTQIIKDAKLLLKDNVLRKEMGRNGYEYVKKKHDSDMIIRQYIKLFNAKK